MGDLTEKQEAFARAYVETGNASEAYRQVCAGENTKPETIWPAASRMLSDCKVLARVDEIRAEAAREAGYTVQQAALEYEEARVLAMAGTNDAKPSAAAAVAAVTGKAKLFGLVTDKSENKTTVEVQSITRKVV